MQTVLQYTQHKNFGNYGAYFQLDDAFEYNQDTKLITTINGTPMIPDRDYRYLVCRSSSIYPLLTMYVHA
jgi:hypothetical protein